MLRNIIQSVAYFGFTVLIVTLFSGQAFAITSSQPVELSIPSTTLTVSGFASPNAIVTVQEGATAIATLSADSSGAFSKQIVRTPGIKNINVFYRDANNRQSVTNRKSISLQSQTNTNHTVFLSPTIELGSQGIVRRGSLVQVRGYSVPNSIINISLDYGTSQFQTSTNSQGYYEYFIDTNTLLEGAHTVSSSAIKGADLSDVSSILTFNVQSEANGFVPDIVVSPDVIPPPSVSLPQDGSIIDGNSVTIYGESLPNAQINIYENNKLISTVTADNAGKWSFVFNATTTPVTLSFEACVNGECSILSRSITLNFTGIRSSCSVEFGLLQYRFWDIQTNENITLEFKDEYNGTIDLNWGDASKERFNVVPEGNRQLTHIYGDSGTYNGSVTLTSDGCEYTRYFSVIVTGGNTNNDVWYASLLIIGLIIGGYLSTRDRKNTR